MLSVIAAPPTATISKLRTGVRGRVVTADDPAFDDLRRVFYGMVDPHPAVIVRAADAADVATVIGVARDSGVELAVRSGGHSGAGHSSVDGGIVLDMRDLRSLDVDVDGRTAWAGSGLTAGEYTEAVAEHGLATGFGDTGSVGIGGITLGGGVGYLVRKHGLTIDSLVAAEVITADGELRRVDADTEPDLFWAIRGGGGNFGVATRFQFRLHPLDGVVGGMLMLPATPDVIASFMAEADAASEDLSAIANVMPAPPMPFVPAEHHGQLVVMALVCCAGPSDEAQRALAPFRSLATSIVDMVRPIRYPEMYPPEDADYRPTAASRTMFIDRVDRDVATLIVDTLNASDASMRVAQLRVLGGAMARVPADASAFAHRDSKIMVNVAAFWEGADDRAIRESWVDAFVGALRQDDQGAYVNFLADEGPEAVRAAYPGSTWTRLQEIKRRYDPTNLFRRNQNIPPA
jgi:FAD/FMN-containing dehydrogenase